MPLRLDLLLSVCVVLVSVSGCLIVWRKVHLDPHWEEFKASFQKFYHSLIEDVKRSKWEKNWERIKRHNEEASSGVHSYTLRVNHLADMTQREYVRRMMTLTKSRKRRLGEEDIVGAPHHDPALIPEELDWRKEGFHTGEWDQKDCGACYAFSVVTSVQGQIWKKTGQLERLSEQQVVDCSVTTGNLGCDGGSLRNTLRYLQSKGLMKFKDYPYLARQTVCRYSANKVAVNITRWAVLPARDEASLKVTVATVGPIPVSLNASPQTFQFYHKGVYDDPKCPGDSVNHAMLLVGYTKDAWILKNWWTKKWGDEGYMYIRRGVNRCGIANFAAYVVV